MTTGLCLALEVIMKDQVEQLNKIGDAASAIGIDIYRSCKETEIARLYVLDICTFAVLFSEYRPFSLRSLTPL